jgi:hypothetical protein
MAAEIPGGDAALAAFDGVVEAWRNHGIDRFVKELRQLVPVWGWEALFPTDDKRLFRNRATGCYSAILGIEYAAARWHQVVEAGYPLLVLHAGSRLDCLDAHADRDGVVIPTDHEYWRVCRPPFNWGCSCYVSGARSSASAERLGGKLDRPLPSDWRQRWGAASVHAATRRDVLTAVQRGDFDLG